MNDLQVRIEGRSAEELGNALVLSGTDHIENDAIAQAVTDWEIETGTSEGALSDGPTIEALNIVMEMTQSVGSQVIAMWIIEKMYQSDQESITINGETIEGSKQEIMSAVEQAVSDEEGKKS